MNLFAESSISTAKEKIQITFVTDHNSIKDETFVISVCVSSRLCNDFLVTLLRIFIKYALNYEQLPKVKVTYRRWAYLR